MEDITYIAKPADLPPVHCWSCAAELPRADAPFCWLCGAPQTATKPVAPPPPRPRGKYDTWEGQAMIWGAVVLALLVGLGVAAAYDKIFAIGYAIAVVPPLFITVIGAASARAGGHPWRPTSKVAMFFSVFALSSALAIVVAALILVLTVFAAFVALVRLCTGQG